MGISGASKVSIVVPLLGGNPINAAVRYSTVNVGTDVYALLLMNMMKSVQIRQWREAGLLGTRMQWILAPRYRTGKLP